MDQQPSKPKKRRYSAKLTRARLAMLRRPYAPYSELAAEASVSLRTMGDARRSLIEDGLLSKDTGEPTDPLDRPEGVVDLSSKPIKTAEDIGALLDADVNLTPQQKRKILDDLAKSADNPQVRIQAILASARLDAAEGKRDALGPGAPLTDEDKVHRLALLLEACGTYLATLAWKQAFKEAPTNDLPSLEAETKETPSQPQAGNHP